MQSEKINLVDSSEVTITRQSGINEGLQATGAYTVECLDASGQVKWTDDFKNLVVTAGKNDILDKYFAGSAYTAAWYLGLVDGASTPTYAAGDTLASHAGWTENTGYSGNRKAPAWGSASSGSKATTATSFTINASGTVAGAFMCTAATGTSGTLYSAGSFTGGNRTVASGDTLNVTYTASV
jgi:hypothetical protein